VDVRSVTSHDVFLAQKRLRGRVRRTPLVHSGWLSRATGAEVWLKLESLQVSHAFKVRGAFNAVAHLMERQPHGAGGPPPTVVTASAGNHGMALAWAAQEAGLRAVVFTPRDAAATKLEAIRRYGADLRAVADNYDDAERMALALAADEEALFVSPYDHPDIIAGGGTVGLEILDELPQVDVVVTPVGGGGLISGIATVFSAVAPATRIVGVEAALNPAFRVAVEHGRVTEIPVFPSIADGLGGNVHPETMTFGIIARHVTELTQATESELRDGIRQLLAHEHLVAEGAGIAAVAAALAGRGVRPGETAAIVVSGANIDVTRLGEILASGQG
jgi:threonine dehydratase